MKLSDNKQLHEYLIWLAARLTGAGVNQLGDTVASAGRRAGAIPATEFLGEARMALTHVLKTDLNALNDSERADLRDVLSQLNTALDER